MKAFFKELRAVLMGERDDIRERFFCVISLLILFCAFLGLMETLPFLKEPLMMVNLLILFLVTVVALVISVRFRRVDLAGVLLGLVLLVIVFPNIFFLNGGVIGGAAIWLCINLIYTFLMFDGITMYVFIVLDVVVNISCYFVAYYIPDILTPLPSREAIMFDSAFSVIATGFAIGVMVKFNIRTYSEKQQMVELQKKELEQLSDSRVSFFASMSHEIRSPINTIIGLNEMILRESKEEETLAYAKNVKNAGKMLLSLVNDILDVSQMETQKMTIVRNIYQTTELFEEVIEMVRTRIDEKNLEFLIHIDENIPRQLHGDKKRIQQIMLNLLTNAIKYTETGSISLDAVAEKKEEDEIILKIAIRDTGIGIKKEDIENIYNIFKRIDQKKNQRIEGSGLGLNITKQLVDLMNGTISVDSIYKRGSVFTVSLKQGIIDETPIGDMMQNIYHNSQTGEKYQQLFEAPEVKIMVVDDIQTNCMVIKKLLEKTKVSIDCVNSGKECLELAKTKAFNIILLDHLMPEMDGIETLRELRKQVNGLCKDSVVIALSANSGSDMEEFYLNQGFDAYLEKPIDSVTLEKTLLSFLTEDLIEYRNTDVDDEASNIHRTISKRKKRVLISTDCVAEIPNELIEKYDIGVMYLYIRTEKGRFADTIEINSDTLENYVTDNTTTAFADNVSVEEYEEFFAEQLTKAEELIYISLAANSGKSYGTAVEAAKSFDHVHIIDSGQVCGGEGLLVMHAAKLAMQGKTTEDIIKSVNREKNRVVSKYIMPSVGIFYQNGYTGKLMMQICRLLQLHPVLQMKKSRITITGVMIGDMKKARKQLVRYTLSHKSKIDEEAVFASHVALSIKEQNELKETINSCVSFDQLYFNRTSFSTACNVGLGAFGLTYFKK